MVARSSAKPEKSALLRIQSCLQQNLIKEFHHLLNILRKRTQAEIFNLSEVGKTELLDLVLSLQH